MELNSNLIVWDTFCWVHFVVLHTISANFFVFPPVYMCPVSQRAYRKPEKQKSAFTPMKFWLSTGSRTGESIGWPTCTIVTDNVRFFQEGCELTSEVVCTQLTTCRHLLGKGKGGDVPPSITEITNWRTFWQELCLWQEAVRETGGLRRPRCVVKAVRGRVRPSEWRTQRAGRGRTKRDYRWIPLYPKGDSPNSEIIESPSFSHLLSPQC